MYAIVRERDLRKWFWKAHPELGRKPGFSQNDYPTDTRVAWCDYVEYSRQTGAISEALAQRATL